MMLTVLPLPDWYRPWLVELLRREWGSPRMDTCGRMYNAAELPALLALLEESPAGVITYRMAGDECEIVALHSVIVGRGAASALLDALREAAQDAGCHRLWLITTNDNTDALEFYQKRGFHLKALYPNAIEESRKLKPEIPQTGRNGIPIRDEMELEMNW